MRVIAITPLPPYPSGLAYYSLYLYRELSKLCNVTILSNVDVNITMPKNLRLIKCFTPSIKSAIKTVLEAFKLQGELVHIQVEYRFIGKMLNFLLLPLLLLLAKMLGAKKKVIITLHGILTQESIQYWLKEISAFKASKIITFAISSLVFYIWILSVMLTILLSDKVIVHNAYIKRRLEFFLTPKMREKLKVIPHGVYHPPSIKSFKNSPPNRHLVMFFGFIRHSKGLHTLIKAIKIARKKIPNLRLLIVGRTLKRGWEKPSIIHPNKILTVIDEEISDEQVDKLIKQTSIIALPYNDRFYEVSGSLHRVALFSKPIICTKIPRFYELSHMDNAVLIEPGDFKQLAKYIVNLFMDKELSRRISKNLFKKFSDRTWDKIAYMHYKLFLEISEVK